MSMKHQLVISCEHAGNLVPDEYRDLFTKELLESHRGYDLGALSYAELFGPVIQNSITRLLVDVNRSLYQPTLFSHECSQEEQEAIIERYYIPYRNQVLKGVVRGLSESDSLLHLSMHSFTPELDGKVRDVDIGLLYDPARKSEAFFVEKLFVYLRTHSTYKVRKNEPYSGVSDGLTTTLRSLFNESYMGIEIELNQKFVRNNAMDGDIARLLYKGVMHAIQ